MENLIQFSRNGAVEALQSIINEWLSQDTSRNLAVLSRVSGVSETSIRRIFASSSILSPQNTHKLLFFLKNGKTHKQVFESIPSDLANYLKFQLSFLQFEELNDYVELGPLEKNLPDYTHQLIFERSSISKGINLDEVKELFGLVGLKAVENLQSADMVSVNADRFVIANPSIKNHTPSIEIIKNLLSQNIRQFYKTDSEYNYIFCVHDGVSLEGYCDVMDILSNAYKQIQIIVKKKAGDIPISAGGFMDTLTSENILVRKEGRNDNN